MAVLLHPEAKDELRDIPKRERKAMHNALEKLEAFEDRLPYPHSSAVKGARSLRELRPRQGRSRWRAFYRRIGEDMVIGSIGAEAQVDQQGFANAVRRAEERLDEVESDLG